MYRFIGLFAFVSVFGLANVARGEPTTPFPHIGVDASLPFQYSNNVLSVPSDRRDDGSASPLFKFSFGQLAPKEGVVGYSVYSTVTSDFYSRIKDAEGALATLGTNLTFITGNFVYGGFYEHTYTYDGIFRQRLFTAEDISGFVTYIHKNKDAGLLIKTSFAPAYRFADDRSVQRATYTLKMDIKKLISGNYYAVVTPKLKFFQYTNETNSGRRDLLASISAGIEYDFNDDVSLTTAVGYENRSSNFDGKNYDAFSIGMSLDFSHTFDRLK